MWILILTILSSDGAVVAAVPGFTSQEQCMAAGRVWRAQVQEHWNARPAIIVCGKA